MDSETDGAIGIESILWTMMQIPHSPAVPDESIPG
jgi:hypothetical protein